MILFKRHKTESESVQRVFLRSLHENRVVVDKIFAWLLIAQWIFGIFCALYMSPNAWEGESSAIHPHVLFAVVMGGTIALLPVMFVVLAPGHTVTRYTVAIGQLSHSALLIHLMGGRIEAHFHVFVSVALLAAYRDRGLLIPAVLLTTIDHAVRGLWWPQSVFGTLVVAPWRPLEHLAWLLFASLSLSYLISQNLRQLLELARMQHSLQQERDTLDLRVRERTRELLDSKVFQERVLNSIDARICILHPNGTILFVNDRWIQAALNAGADLNSVGVGANYLRVCQRVRGPEGVYAKAIADAICDIRDGRRLSYATEYPCEFGNERLWFHVQLNCVPMDGSDAIAVVHVDITATKRAQSNATSLAKLFTNAPHETYIIDRNTLKLIEINDGVCQNLGYRRDELLTMTFTDIACQIDRSDLQRALDSLETNALEVVTLEWQHRRKDQSLYWCSASIHSSTYEDQDVFVMFVMDQTQQRQLEADLRQSQKLESVGQLAAGVAHEINSPMQCVSGNVEFIEKSIQKVFQLTDRIVNVLEKSDIDWENERRELAELRTRYRYDYIREQAPKAIKEAAEASSRVISIVRAMKILAHPGTSARVLTDLHELISNAAMITRSRWKYVANIKYYLDPSLHSIELLPAEMSQVFINLFVNAADAIVERFGESPEELGVITVATALSGDRVLIRISDNGCGIPSTIKHRIYDPFFTTKEVGKGTGQGLAITYDIIVNKHQGTIQCDTTENSGTCFEISLPRFKSPEVEMPQSSTSSVTVPLTLSASPPAGSPVMK